MARGHSQRAARVGGFTLIELVVVITVMGILSIGVVSFITDASDGYAIHRAAHRTRQHVAAGCRADDA